nr:uncharacterized protein LOC126538366 [Dermacentor andersoni]
MRGASNALQWARGLMRCAYFSLQELGTKLALMYNPDPTQYVPLWFLQQRYNYFLWLNDGTRSAGQAATLLDKAVMLSTLGRDAREEVNAGVHRTRLCDKTKLPLQIYDALKLLLTVDKGLDKIASNATHLRLSVDGMTTATQMYHYLGSNLHHLREVKLLFKTVSWQFTNSEYWWLQRYKRN